MIKLKPGYQGGPWSNQTGVSLLEDTGPQRDAKGACTEGRPRDEGARRRPSQTRRKPAYGHAALNKPDIWSQKLSRVRSG